MFTESAAPLADSTMMYKLVSSANKLFQQPRFFDNVVYIDKTLYQYCSETLSNAVKSIFEGPDGV